MPVLDALHEVAIAGLAPQPVNKFLSNVAPLSVAEKRTIVEQALLLMEEVYVHLPLKRAMHAVDPVQRLRLLRHRVEMVDERTFHEEMISTFMGVRDLHTNYILPAPYNRAIAFLPFQIREFFHGSNTHYIVSGLVQGFEHDTFKPGAIVTHWNGVPIARAVELNARRNAGSNAAANHARGLEHLTFRPLMMSLPPDEEWVDIRYVASDGKTYDATFVWLVSIQQPMGADASAIHAIDDPNLKWKLAQGVDIQTQAVNQLKKHLFAAERIRIEKAVMAYLDREGLEGVGDAPDFDTVSTMPDVLSFETKQTAKGPRGYIRIHTFSVEDHVAFVEEFVRILELMPKDGLILDVRGNGGGNIIAGEMLLQTMSPRRIEAERLHFINTPTMVQLVEGVPTWFDKWIPSMKHALLIGAAYSQGLTFEPEDDYNTVGRKYFGPVVLLTDAFCYSTTDIFSAGFQDHGIGPVLGTDGNTGAGGANVFTWDLLRDLFGSFSQQHPFRLLPKGANLRVAIRRTTRVRDKAGVPLEDLGVEPNVVHKTTLEDIINGDVDLFTRAAELMAPA